jgi:hypothetical protein
MFTAFSLEENSLLLRVSLYDPSYFMPFQANYKIQVNFPPVFGEITISPSEGISVSTKFTITASNWLDEDKPLSYKF